MSERNLTMLTDLYQLTMMNGYLHHGMGKNRAVFDLFYRKTPDSPTSYAVAAGLDSVIQYVNNIHFSEDDTAYLRSLGLFSDDFLAMLSNIRFTGDIYAVPEGTVIFPGEPIIRVHAPILEAQLLETTMLNLVNHQTLIATKASRVVEAAKGDSVLEFGLRRAQGPDAGIYGARAAIIGGCESSSNVMMGELFNIPVKGTHAHSWVMSFPDELTAFRAYAEVYPDSCLLLVDTYDTLRSGVKNAITVFDELRAGGHTPVGIRLDSGDLSYLSREARRMLDDAGFEKAKIFASGDLDEELIWDLKAQGACIDVWGVGTRLITSHSNPALGGVYKMAAEEVDGKLIPKIKISENPAKITTPGLKQLYRIYGSDGMAVADLITLDDELVEPPLTLFDPVDTWKRMTIQDFTARQMLKPVFVDGRQVYSSPSLLEIQKYCKAELATFWQQYRRLTNPHRYKVDLSERLYSLKQDMLREQADKIGR